MENIYYRSILKKKVRIEPKYLNENLDTFILNYLQNKIEGKCMDEGYIRPDSIKILIRSVGRLEGSRFTGDITYEVKFSADICNPSIGMIVEAKVKSVTKVGILCINGPLVLFIPKKNHEDNIENFLKIKVGDTVKIEIESKKFSLNDKEIELAGRINGMKNKKNKSKNNDLKNSSIESASASSILKSSDEPHENDDDNDIDDIEISDSEDDEDSDEDSDDDEEEDLEEELEEQHDENEFLVEAIKDDEVQSVGDEFDDDDDEDDDLDDGDDGDDVGVDD